MSDSLLFNLYVEDCINTDNAGLYRSSGDNKYRGVNPIYGATSTNPDRFFIDTERNFFWDFGDGVGGGVVKYLTYVRGLTMQKACVVAGIDNYIPDELNAVYAKAQEYYQSLLEHSTTAQEYLESRGFDAIDQKTFGLGYSGSLEEGVSITTSLREEFGSLVDKSGLLNYKGTPVFQNAITIPFFNGYDEIHYFSGRSITKTDDSRYMKLESKKVPYFGSFGKTKTYLVEGLFDRLTLEKYGYSSISLVQASCDKYTLLKIAEEAKANGNEIVFLADKDLAGKKLLSKMTSICEQKNVMLAVKPLPEIYRIESQQWNIKDPDDFFNCPYWQQIYQQEANKSPTDSDTIVAGTNTRKVEAFNAIREIPAIEQEILDLHNPTDEFVERIAFRIGWYPNEITKARLVESLATVSGRKNAVITKITKQDRTVDSWITEDKIPEVEREFDKNDLEQILMSPNILDEIISITESLGHIGESKLKKALLLAFINRINKEPIHVQVIGESSSGKSSTVEQILQFFSERDCILLTSMSKLALNYLGSFEGGVMHKILYLGENGGNTDPEVVATVRQLMSEGKIVRGVVAKDENEEWAYENIETRGPLQSYQLLHNCKLMMN